MSRAVSQAIPIVSRPLRGTTCIAAIIAGISAISPVPARGQLLTLTGLSTDLGLLSTKVDDQGIKISATTTLANTLNTNLNAVTTTVANQGNALQTVQTNLNSTTLNLASITGTVSQQQVALTAATGVLGVVTTDLRDLTSAVGLQASTLQDLQASVSGNVADLAGVSATIDQQAAQITLSLGALDTLNSSLGTLQGVVTDQSTTLQALQGTVANTTGDLGTLTGTVTQLAGEVADHSLKILDHATDIGALQARVGANVSDIAGLQASIGSTDGNLAALQVTVDNHGVRIATNTTDIAALSTTVGAHASTLSQQGGDLATAAANIASLESLVHAQAGTLGTLGTAVTAQGTLLSQHDSRITANADAILSLRNMAVSGNASPVQYTTPSGPLVATTAATNDVAILGAQSGPVRLHNIDAGALAADSTDAVNGGQLFAVSEQLDGLATLAVRYDDATRTRIAFGDASAAPVVLANVAPGNVAPGSTEAVNGGQLADTNSLLASLGNTVTSQASDLVQARTDVTTLGSAVTAQAASLTAAEASLVTLRLDARNGAIGPVRYADPSAPLVPSNGVVTNDLVLVGRDPQPVALHNVADGRLDSGSTDAVNGGQLFALASSYQGLADLAIRYDDAAQASATLGRAGTPVTLRNIAAGTLAANSTDAATGGQLFDLASATSNLFGTGFSYNAVTGFSGSFAFEGNNYNTIQSVFGAIETSLSNIGAGGAGTVYDNGTKYFHANSALADSHASGADSTAIGPASVSSGNAAIALGRHALAGGDSSVAIGDGAQAMNGKAVSIGLGNVASGDGAVAIGDPNYATGEGATALGKDNAATGVGAIALGNVNIATGDGSTAIGSMNKADGLGAAALGYTNVADGRGAIAIGANNAAMGDGALAIGANVMTSADDTLAIGNSAQAHGVRAVAIGNTATASATNSSSFGYDALASSGYSTAVGTSGRATGFGSTALGALAEAGGYASTALGSGAIADKEGSVALGSASQTTRGAVASYRAFGLGTIQQSLGEVAIARNIAYLDPVTGVLSPTGTRQITGVAAGSAGTDAVNVDQLRGVSTAIGSAFVNGFGGGAKYDTLTGELAAPTYTLNGVTYSNVGDALQALSSRYGATGTPGSGSPSTGNTTGGTAPTDPTQNNGGTGSSGSTNTGGASSSDAQLAAASGRIAAAEARAASAEAKAEQAIAESSRSVQYDSGDTGSITLGNGTSPVAIHNVATGVAESDAVNVRQMNSGLVAAVAEANDYTDQRMAALSFDLRKVNRDVSAGVAGAMALAGMPQPFEAGKSMFSMGAGTFQGQSAVAMGVSRIMNDGHTVVKLGATYNSRKRVGANIGVGYQF